MSPKYSAKLDNRTFSFILTESKPTEIRIDMYNTPYTFVLKDDKWQNHSSNKMDMSPGLIQAVMKELGQVHHA